MRVRLISDLHLDVFPLQGAQESAPLCIVCGDVMNGKPTQVIDKICALLPDERILFVPGNHEGYGVRDWNECMRQLQQACLSSKRVTLLYRKNTVIDGWNFIGAPLWTSFRIPELPDQTLNMQRAVHLNSDYKNLRFKGKIATPSDVLQLHIEDLQFLQKATQASKLPSVIITHHAPTLKSIVPKFIHHSLNPCFVNHLDSSIFQSPHWWFHGHSHHSFDYMHHGVRIISNPRGYAKSTTQSEENPSFKLDFFLQLSQKPHVERR